MTPTSLGQVLLDEAAQDPETWKKLSAAVHRTQLWAYRAGKTKPSADTAATIAAVCSSVPADAWGKEAPKKGKRKTSAPVIAVELSPTEEPVPDTERPVVSDVAKGDAA